MSLSKRMSVVARVTFDGRTGPPTIIVEFTRSRYLSAANGTKSAVHYALMLFPLELTHNL